ncbi:membrane protein [Hydrogenovibrio crunogenus]|uniref:Ancillary SecYEG translocon subunit n=1 Tax=Hydrogenovibrio crunogenus TaxID=39765 RepID=A0A4P7NYC6_9GAMM|nr:tetratricopeptide repeat protein [Hydrogenovibrio crunogenus]QBZ82628.1 membrane protein [Hydrogenovibrio crunogenus]RUM90411.1 MAG: hypothetical protein DSZ27_09240 [Thiomicrospira sp.]
MSRYETDEEQVEAIKSWWKKNGTQLLSGILVIVLAWTGWTYWQNAQMTKALNASAVFEVMQVKQSQNALGDVLRDGLKLMEEQPDSPYASGVALMIAKHYFDENAFDKAIENYQWTIEHAPDHSIELIARLRLVTVYVQEKMFEKADQVLAGIDQKALSLAEKGNYDFQVAELALTEGDLSQAKEAYNRVVSNAEAPESVQNLAKLKLADLAG